MREAPRTFKIGILWPAAGPRFAASISTGEECDVVFAGSKPGQGEDPDIGRATALRLRIGTGAVHRIELQRRIGLCAD